MPVAYQNTPCSIFASGCVHLKKKGHNENTSRQTSFIPCVKLQLSMYSTDIEIISQRRKQRTSAAEIA